MLKNNELRIGNLVYPDMSYPESITVCVKDFEDTSHLNPIPLTEEWLLRAGFEKLTSIEKGFKSNSYTYVRGFSFIVHLNNGLLSINFWQGNEKKFVHQLQNLFFSLTGEELVFSSTET